MTDLDAVQQLSETPVSIRLDCIKCFRLDRAKITGMQVIVATLYTAACVSQTKRLQYCWLAILTDVF
jgi:hypothetical protein